MQEPASEAEVLIPSEAARGEAEVETSRLRAAGPRCARRTAREQPAEVGLLEQAPLHAGGREVLADEPLLVLVAGADVQKAHVLTAHLAGELRADVDALRACVGAETDAAAEERLHLLAAEPVAVGAGEVEERSAVQEEVATLREEEREAREIDLALIDLRLREVGVHGDVGAQTGRGVVEHVHAGVLAVVPSRGARHRR